MANGVSLTLFCGRSPSSVDQVKVRESPAFIAFRPYLVNRAPVHRKRSRFGGPLSEKKTPQNIDVMVEKALALFPNGPTCE